MTNTQTTKHTPGPWIACKNREEDTHTDRIKAADLRNVAFIPSYEHPLEEMEANAQLIAAAPQLAEALLEIITQLESMDGLIEGSNDYEMCKVARHAIKAAGLVS